jgi:uncharacterized RDD family membrane protein YckC
MHNTHALLKKRFAAFSIDLAIIASLQLTLGSLTLWFYQAVSIHFNGKPSEDTVLFLSQFCGGFFFLIYFTLSVGLFGNTVGKHLMQLKVIHQKTGEGLTLSQAYWRSMGYLMSSWTYMIGFTLPLFREDKRALHDLLCDTLVVKQAPNEALNAPQLELPLFANVHQIQTPTKKEALPLAQTGTDH